MGRKLHYFIGFLILVIIVAMFIPRTEETPLNKLNQDTVTHLPQKSDFEIQVVEPYDSLMENLLLSDNVVGLASAIVYGDKVLYLKSFGKKSIDSDENINDSTLFRLASLSKGFTGILAGILDEEHTISLDDKIVDYIPGFELKNSANTQNLTISHILSHTSGIIPHAYDNMVEADVPMSEISARLKEVEISGLPGELYSYQNVIFSLYDSITALTTHQTFCKNLKDKIFTPLQMKYAFAGLPNPEQRENFAMPHQKVKNGFKLRNFNDNYYNVNPAAGVNASISDMSKWMLALLGNNPGIISQEVLHKVFTPQIITPLPRRYFPQWSKIQSKEYGLGWRIVKQNNKKLIYHGGYVDGYKSEIALLPDLNMGIVIMTNSPTKYVSGCLPLFLDLIDIYINKTDQIVAN